MIIEDYRKRMGRQIRAIRKPQMTLQVLAEKTGISKSNLSLLENGKYNATIDILYRVMSALDAKIAFVPEKSEGLKKGQVKENE